MILSRTSGAPLLGLMQYGQVASFLSGMYVIDHRLPSSATGEISCTVELNFSSSLVRWPFQSTPMFVTIGFIAT
jgi:hypothetical protein